MPSSPSDPQGAAAIAAAHRLLDDGRPRAAVDHLLAARGDGDPEIDRALVAIRHRAALALLDAGPPGPAPAPSAVEHDPFPDPGIPEVTSDDLDLAVLRAALAHRGSLLVRGLLADETVARLLDDVERALAAADEWDERGPGADTEGWYTPFEAEDPTTFGGFERFAARTSHNVLTVESPRTLEDVVAALQGAGLGELLEGYFGEWPMISAKKSTLRLATANSRTGWHQDGAFLGSTTRTVNVWVALTPCGLDAPGVEVFGRAFPDIVTTGTGGAEFTWSVGDEHAASLDGPLEVPTFEPGDALLFDQLTLHRTHITPSMRHRRYAIESWFFAPSTYPMAQVPILF